MVISVFFKTDLSNLETLQYTARSTYNYCVFSAEQVVSARSIDHRSSQEEAFLI